MATFNGINYANSDAYIKSNLLYMNIFTGKSESHDINGANDDLFLSNMMTYLDECKNILSSIRINLGNHNRRIEPISEKMIKYFSTDGEKHSFPRLSDSYMFVYDVLRDFKKSLNEDDILFSKEVEHLLEYSNDNLEKDVLHTMKDKITCMKNTIPCGNYDDNDKYGVLHNMSGEKLLDTIKATRRSLLYLKDDLVTTVNQTYTFIERVIERYNNMSNNELKDFKLSAIYLNITLGMQLKILTHRLDTYFNYSKLYDTRFEILKGECK